MTFLKDQSISNVVVIMLLRFGSGAAQAGAATGADTMAVGAPSANPHLNFADCNAQGYGLMQVSPSGIEATLVTINRPTEDLGDAGQGIAGTATFTLSAGDPSSLSEPVLTRRKPFPL